MCVCVCMQIIVQVHVIDHMSHKSYIKELHISVQASTYSTCYNQLLHNEMR